jgi:L-rhamnose mutarotase
MKMKDYLKTTTYTSFKRYCKVLKLQDNKSLIEKYKEVHKPGSVWPEITRGIREVGILDMEIYIHGNHVFMIMDTVPAFDHDKAMKELAGKPMQKEWEEYVSQFQQAGDKAATPEKWEIVERIFVLEKND